MSEPYRMQLGMLLPPDPPWRDEEQTLAIQIEAPDPEGAWRAGLSNMSKMLGLGDGPTIMGLLFNLINSMPDEIRISFVEAIINGVGIFFNEENGQLMGMLAKKYDGLADENGQKERASGLIVPGGIQ